MFRDIVIIIYMVRLIIRFCYSKNILNRIIYLELFNVATILFGVQIFIVTNNGRIGVAIMTILVVTAVERAVGLRLRIVLCRTLFGMSYNDLQKLKY